MNVDLPISMGPDYLCYVTKGAATAVRFFLLAVAVAAPVLSWTRNAPQANQIRPTVLPGLDHLREIGGGPLRGKRLGLITNQTGRAIDGTPAHTVLRDELGLHLVALFSPEHGFEGDVAAGGAVATGAHAASGLPVFSLYGQTRKPTPEMLRGIDALVFDIQDIGVRHYTYISTLKLAMEAAAQAKIEFVVLDRPNPNTGIRVEGPVLESRFSSFVGIAPIATLHGMTVGELARMFDGEGMLEAEPRVDLTVIPVRGWRRSMKWQETGIPWRPTSPNIRTVAASIAYPALGLFEGINVSEGRGTHETFLIAGAPWIRADGLVAALEKLGLPGVRFTPGSFVPRVIPEAPDPIYPDEQCLGFFLQLTEPDRFEAVRTGLSAIATIRRLYPRRFEWEMGERGFIIDWLLGTDVPRRRIESGESVERIVEMFEPELERFRRRRALYLLYS